MWRSRSAVGIGCFAFGTPVATPPRNQSTLRFLALDRDRSTIWIVDAHRNGKRFIVQADEELTAFVGLKSAIGTLA